jgi:hypothetical protein
LLGPVVQVALDPPSGLVARGHDPRPGGGQIRPGPGEGGDGVVHAGQQVSPGALEGGDVRAVVQPVVADRGVGRPDLVDQALRRDVQVAEGRRDVADLVAPGVAHVEGQVAT